VADKAALFVLSAIRRTIVLFEIEVRKRLALCLTALLFATSTYGSGSLSVRLSHGSEEEQETQRQLARLLDRFDLSKWLFTDAIVIDDHAIPHSHPVLTLHTRHRRDDLLLLSTFIHEETHWFLEQHVDDRERAMKDLGRQYPRLPVGFPKGSTTYEENYEHLIVIYLEWQKEKQLVGELVARQLMEFWATDHYTTIYQTVLDHEDAIAAVVQRHNLIPPGLLR
jgi:hypothetical protein